MSKQQQDYGREVIESLPKDPKAGDLGYPDSDLTEDIVDGKMKLTDGETYIMAEQPFFTDNVAKYR